MSEQQQCPSQYHGHGCGRPAGHPDTHYSADRMAGWVPGAETARGPWMFCDATHPTTGARCNHVAGHRGTHYALTVPIPDGEPLGVQRLPFVEWKTPRRPS